MRELRNAVLAVVLTTVVLGLAYPVAMTGAAQLLWPHKADGDATLIARAYPDSLFQARPSATGYATAPTAFNNQGPNQRALADQLGRYLHD
jgi:K+-transporting ATPase ATPase C chain